MRFSPRTSVLTAIALLCASGGALAQDLQPPPTPAPPAGGPLYDPQQFPTQRGVVQQFTLTPRGDIDGFILSDGLEVKTPPHLSTQIAYSVRPGDMVTIRGLRAAAISLVRAVSVTDEANGRTVVDDGSPGPARGPAPPAPRPGAVPGTPLASLSEIAGRVRITLHGAQGEVNGALMEDGTVLRLPPPEAARFASLLQPGQSLVAQGVESKTAVGAVMEAREIGASRDQLNVVEGPPDRGRRPPPPLPGAAPPPPPRS
jgi:hypothetical protein